MCVEKPDDFADALFDYDCRFEHGVTTFPHVDPNIRGLVAIGAILLSWSTAIAKAKICDANRFYESDEERKEQLELCTGQIREYLSRVLQLSLEIAPKLNERNASLCD